MNDNYLKVVKECGALENEMSADGAWNICMTDEVFKAYTSRILASQQAAHDAEIAKMRDLIDRQAYINADLQIRFSTANERIAHLEGLVAVKDEALKDLHYALYGNGTGSAKIEAAISASAETVQAFRDKLTEPLRREVAQAHSIIVKYQSAGVGNSTCFATQFEANRMACDFINNTQATAQAYEQEVEARGAVKALEDAATKFAYEGGLCPSMNVEVELLDMAAKLRATSKKAG